MADTEELVKRLRAHECNGWAQIDDLMDQAAKLLEERTRELVEAREGESRWLQRVSAIREASGLGAKPMLDELPGEIAKIAARARIADELIGALEACGDDPEAEALVRGARSLLSRARERKG